MEILKLKTIDREQSSGCCCRTESPEVWSSIKAEVYEKRGGVPQSEEENDDLEFF